MIPHQMLEEIASYLFGNDGKEVFIDNYNLYHDDARLLELIKLEIIRKKAQHEKMGRVIGNLQKRNTLLSQGDFFPVQDGDIMD